MWARWFCIVYDTLITKPFFRNHVLLMVWSLQGFQSTIWFTLMLLDVFRYCFHTNKN